MATEVAIPNLGYTMTMAKILGWFKSVGDPIEAGETLLEIETDKVNYGIESPASGVVKAILVNIGDEVPVGGTVAIVGRKNEEIEISRYSTGELKQPRPPSVQPLIANETIAVVSQPEDQRLLASPVARKIAKERGINLSLIKGSGRSGRIRMADVERFLREAKPVRPEVIPPSGFPEVAEIIPMTTMRRTIAQRLTQSFHDAPHFNLCTEVDMTEVNKLRQVVGNKIEVQTGTKLSLNDIFIKAVAVTLCDHPRLNARLREDRVEVLTSINIGLAVALEDGLIVPAIERADQKRLWQITKERNDLVERARSGRLTLLELERGTFTISNLGMFDITFFTSILNPPQSGILSIGKTMEKPAVREGSIVVRPIAEMSLTVDHRIVDGAVGAQFLQDLKRSLEDPYLLV